MEAELRASSTPQLVSLLETFGIFQGAEPTLAMARAALLADAREALGPEAIAASPTLAAAASATACRRLADFAAAWGLSPNTYGEQMVLQAEAAAGGLAAMWRRLFTTFCVSRLPPPAALKRSDRRVLLIGPGLGLMARSDQITCDQIRVNQTRSDQKEWIRAEPGD